MKWMHSFRYQLSVLYLITIIVPTIIIIFFMPYYFKQVIINNSRAETKSTVAALSRNIEIYLDDLERLTITPYLNNEVMKALSNKANHHGVEDTYTALMTSRILDASLSSYMKMARTDILGTTMLFNDGTAFVKSIDLSDPVKSYSFEKQPWYKTITEADGRVVYIGPHNQDYWKGHKLKKVFSVARVIKEPDTQQKLAIIMADADAKVFQRIIDDTKFQVNSIVAILDEELNPLFTSKTINDSLLTQLNANQTIINEGRNDSYFVIKGKLKQNNWQVIVLLPYSDIQSKFRWVYVVGILFGIGGLILTVTLFAIQSRRTTKPFQEMTNVMKRVQTGHLDMRVTIRGKDEISQLGLAMNTMINRLNDLIEREYRTQLGLKEAELRSLQAQIQPHFLYNVLNGILGLNRKGHKEEIESAILSLSHMMRYVLSKKDMTRLSEELDFLRSYCALQKMRLGSRGFSYRIECVPELESIQIPKLLLQPLVENAIIHGIEPLYSPSELLITACLDKDEANISFVNLIVADTGIGFAEEKSDKGNHIGLQNVINRMKLTYPGSEINIQSVLEQGTVIKLTLPAKGIIEENEVKV
ncbi:cache domain-containing sensor histidine kinase [Paenibacillus sp. Soil750]|uniref:cache domain-containing sensor histidine kinase n=1 Tax=Paenibacillus sp. Soil750 TaxID=1736398 RepID=UPI0006FB058E|nr:sensor histidine kinase [Paenibacillus sp. Soil750]KRE64552.1 hypothetical protein ASL11_20955 [Paenibacillus sp. Soil750]